MGSGYTSEVQKPQGWPPAYPSVPGVPAAPDDLYNAEGNLVVRAGLPVPKGAGPLYTHRELLGRSVVTGRPHPTRGTQKQPSRAGSSVHSRKRRRSR